MLPDDPNEEESQEELPEDNETPFRPAGTSRDPDIEEADDDKQPYKEADDTRPETDSGVQSEELYDSGVGPASSIDDPKNGGVVGYSPPSDDDDEDKQETEEGS